MGGSSSGPLRRPGTQLARSLLAGPRWLGDHIYTLENAVDARHLVDLVVIVGDEGAGDVVEEVHVVHRALVEERQALGEIAAAETPYVTPRTARAFP